MDKKTKVLLSLLFSLICLSIAATYYKYVVLNEFETYIDDYGEEGVLEDVPQEAEEKSEEVIEEEVLNDISYE